MRVRGTGPARKLPAIQVSLRYIPGGLPRSHEPQHRVPEPKPGNHLLGLEIPWLHPPNHTTSYSRSNLAIKLGTRRETLKASYWKHTAQPRCVKAAPLPVRTDLPCTRSRRLRFVECFPACLVSEAGTCSAPAGEKPAALPREKTPQLGNLLLWQEKKNKRRESF